MKIGRYLHKSIYIDGINSIIIIGGMENDNNVLDTTEILNLYDNSVIYGHY